MENMSKISEEYKRISETWKKAGLNFAKTILLFTPPGTTKEELEVDKEFKRLAREELDKNK
jgi:hypothetical protein